MRLRHLMLASTRTSARPLHPSHNAFQCSVIKQQAVAGVEHRHDPVIKRLCQGLTCGRALMDCLAPCRLCGALDYVMQQGIEG